MKMLVTGGAGFIGSAVVRYIIKNTTNSVVNIDKLTYAGHLNSVNMVAGADRYIFAQADICEVAIFKPAESLKLINKAPVTKAITTTDYPTPAKRPAYSMLNCDKISQPVCYQAF